jgi:thiol:disulfide interchange protein
MRQAVASKLQWLEQRLCVFFYLKGKETLLLLALGLLLLRVWLLWLLLVCLSIQLLLLLLGLLLLVVFGWIFMLSLLLGRHAAWHTHEKKGLIIILSTHYVIMLVAAQVSGSSLCKLLGHLVQRDQPSNGLAARAMQWQLYSNQPLHSCVPTKAAADQPILLLLLSFCC